MAPAVSGANLLLTPRHSLPSMSSAKETLHRQWLMLQWIPRHPQRTTARDLAERLAAEGYDVSKRTVERDLDSLSAAFPLVADEREKPFGWSWQRDAPAFSLPGMSPLQAMVLQLAHSHLVGLMPSHLMDQLAPYFTQASLTLSQVPNRGLAGWSEKVETIAPNQPLLPPIVDEDVLATVHLALQQDRQINIQYRARSAGEARLHRVHPLGIVQRGPVTYLICRFAKHEDIASLPVHRILAAEPLEDAVVRPDGFTLHDFVHGGAMGFFDRGQIRLVLRMEAPAAEHLRETRLSEDQVIATDTDPDWVVITATVRYTSQLVWWINSFGDQVEVLEPEALEA